MRGATTVDHAAALEAVISIHAPHAGRDDVIQGRDTIAYISIHAPHAGRDEMVAILA